MRRGRRDPDGRALKSWTHGDSLADNLWNMLPTTFGSLSMMPIQPAQQTRRVQDNGLV